MKGTWAAGSLGAPLVCRYLPCSPSPLSYLDIAPSVGRTCMRGSVQAAPAVVVCDAPAYALLILLFVDSLARLRTADLPARWFGCLLLCALVHPFITSSAPSLLHLYTCSPTYPSTCLSLPVSLLTYPRMHLPATFQSFVREATCLTASSFARLPLCRNLRSARTSEAMTNNRIRLIEEYNKQYDTNEHLTHCMAHGQTLLPPWFVASRISCPYAFERKGPRRVLPLSRYLINVRKCI